MAKAKISSKNSKTKQAVRNRTRLEWLLFAALLLIGFLFLASRYSWWPLNDSPDLGSAFYTSRKVPSAATTSSSATPASGVGSTGSGSGSSTTGRNATSNNSTTTRSTTTTNTGGGGGSGTPDPGGGGSSGTSTAPLLSFAAGVNVGNSKQQVDATVNGLNENCAVVVNLPLGLGRQEVCIYSQNGATVTVTYLNDHVLSASLAGL